MKDQWWTGHTLDVLPDLDSLRCFEAAAARLNFREAASLVGLSPPAFSQRIRRLEEQLEAKLFERTTRRVALTTEGVRLRPHARRCIEQAGQCHAVAHANSSPSYELTLGIGRELGVRWIMPQMIHLEDQQPQRDLNLFFGRPGDLFQNLRRGVVDCVVVGGGNPGSESFTSELLVPQRYVFVASADLMASTPLVSAENAANHTLLDIDDRTSLFQHFAKARDSEQTWNFAGSREFGTLSQLRAAVLASQGVAVLPRICVEELLQAGALVEVMPECPPQSDWIRMYWLAGHPRSAQMAELAACLRPARAH